MVFDLAYDYDACLARYPSLKKSDIDVLKKWIQTLDCNSTVPVDITNKQLLVFHLACNQVMEDTKKCIKIHYNLRAKGSDQFDNRDASTKEMLLIPEVLEFAYLPVKTDEGYGVALHRLHDFSPEKYNFIQGCKYFCMTLDAYINENGPDKGVLLLLDMRGIKLGHITRVNIGVMIKYLSYVQEGLNARIISIHVLNTNSLIDKIMQLVRPFLTGDLIKRIVWHQPNMNWDDFYRNTIPKRCLPSDFGGDLPDTQTLARQNAERLLRSTPFFTAEEKQRHFYTKENGKKSTRIPPTFTKLDID